MKYRVTRTSVDMGDIRCEDAKLEYQNVGDDIEDEWDEVYERVYTIDINSVDDLYAFSEKYGSIVIKESDDIGLHRDALKILPSYTIEIYDQYRE